MRLACKISIVTATIIVFLWLTYPYLIAGAIIGFYQTTGQGRVYNLQPQEHSLLPIEVADRNVFDLGSISFISPVSGLVETSMYHTQVRKFATGDKSLAFVLTPSTPKAISDLLDTRNNEFFTRIANNFPPLTDYDLDWRMYSITPTKVLLSGRAEVFQNLLLLMAKENVLDRPTAFSIILFHAAEVNGIEFSTITQNGRQATTLYNKNTGKEMALMTTNNFSQDELDSLIRSIVIH